MRTRDLKGRKFHYDGEDESGSVYMSECTDNDKVVRVRLDKPTSGVPIKLGQEMCQVRPDSSGHFSINDALAEDADDSDGDGGPVMVNSDLFRSGWDRIFGPN
jgi:hypothetical protein